MGILRSYIVRLHLVPFLLGLGVVTFILEMDALIQYMDLIVTRGVPFGVVAQIFFLSAGFVLAMSLPCAVLVAVLMTFGRLSQDNEITALRAGGINLVQVVAALPPGPDERAHPEGVGGAQVPSTEGSHDTLSAWEPGSDSRWGSSRRSP